MIRKTLFLSVVSLFLLTACMSMGPPPETLNQRLAMVQISYGVLLDKAILYHKEGRLSESQQEKLTGLFNDIELAIQSSRAAIDLADIDWFNQESGMMIKALSAIRGILSEPPT